MTPEERAQDFAKLREKFPPSAIGKIPRGGKGEKRRCSECGGWHAPGATHLDYVGHAQVTSRLLDVDPEWTWEPMAVDQYGLPLFDCAQNGAPVGLWIKLTVLGHTRLGYGSVQPGAFDSVKQLIGDAIRNAAMRFGVALDLWSKEELVSDSAGSSHPSQGAPAKAPPKHSETGVVPPPETSSAAPVSDHTQKNGEVATDNKDVPDTALGEDASVPPGSSDWLQLIETFGASDVLKIAQEKAKAAGEKPPFTKKALNDLSPALLESVAADLAHQEQVA